MRVCRGDHVRMPTGAGGAVWARCRRLRPLPTPLPPASHHRADQAQPYASARRRRGNRHHVGADDRGGRRHPQWNPTRAWHGSPPITVSPSSRPHSRMAAVREVVRSRCVRPVVSLGAATARTRQDRVHPASMRSPGTAVQPHHARVQDQAGIGRGLRRPS
jgi:hypothetical protein